MIIYPFHSLFGATLPCRCNLVDKDIRGKLLTHGTRLILSSPFKEIGSIYVFHDRFIYINLSWRQDVFYWVWVGVTPFRWLQMISVTKLNMSDRFLGSPGLPLKPNPIDFEYQYTNLAWCYRSLKDIDWTYLFKGELLWEIFAIFVKLWKIDVVQSNFALTQDG